MASVAKEELEAVFHLPSAEAARQLGLGARARAWRSVTCICRAGPDIPLRVAEENCEGESTIIEHDAFAEWRVYSGNRAARACRPNAGPMRRRRRRAAAGISVLGVFRIAYGVCTPTTLFAHPSAGLTMLKRVSRRFGIERCGPSVSARGRAQPPVALSCAS